MVACDASNRSMSYICTSIDVSMVPVSCHCQVVPGLAAHTARIPASPGASPGDAASMIIGATSELVGGASAGAESGTVGRAPSLVSAVVASGPGPAPDPRAQATAPHSIHPKLTRVTLHEDPSPPSRGADPIARAYLHAASRAPVALL